MEMNMKTQRANISEDRINAIAATAGCSRERSVEILDPEYTYWSERGDSTKDGHFAYLENASVPEIAGWVRSISRDMDAE